MHIHKKNAKKSIFLYRMLPMGVSVKCKVYRQQKNDCGWAVIFCYQEKRNNYPFWL